MSRRLFVLCLLSINLSLSFNQLLTDSEDEDDVQYCPAGFSAVGDQCFIKKERNNRDKARIACRDIGASLPELHTWDQQSNLEKFLTDQSISGPAWLNGEVGYTHHRENSVKFFWPTRYFPRFHNFKEMPTSTKGRTDSCVYISPRESFHWRQGVCSSVIETICVMRHVPTYISVTSTNNKTMERGFN
ncbi:hypothetical protein Btru_018635 [Bulinus truncatus]|nr:hypothetical protein Btru_018635 [Bulinus truncatus]